MNECLCCIILCFFSAAPLCVYCNWLPIPALTYIFSFSLLYHSPFIHLFPFPSLTLPSPTFLPPVYLHSPCHTVVTHLTTHASVYAWLPSTYRLPPLSSLCRTTSLNLPAAYVPPSQSPLPPSLSPCQPAMPANTPRISEAVSGPGGFPMVPLPSPLQSYPSKRYCNAWIKPSRCMQVKTTAAAAAAVLLENSRFLHSIIKLFDKERKGRKLVNIVHKYYGNVNS